MSIKGRAVCMLRTALHYRRDAFVGGLKAAGLKVLSQLSDPRPGDVLVLWNRYGGYHEVARQWERAGARVLIAENGYIGQGYYALAEGHHAGAGRWPYDGPQRWDALGIELRPWRQSDAPPLVLGQRGIGEPGIASPLGWAERMARRIGGGRIRAHPGKYLPPVPLDADILASGCVVTWASSAALHALRLGVPVWYDCHHWIGGLGARHVSEWGQPPCRSDAARLGMFQRLAWAQWTLEEIRSGAAYERILAL